MPVTINVNRLSLVHETSEGVSSATLPNVCANPHVGLVPYPSTAFSKDLAGGTRDVVADGGSSIAVRGSTFARSSGDEPGTSGGVVSRVNGAESQFLSWSLDVKIEGRNACRLTDKMLHNHGNTINCSGVTQPVVAFGLKHQASPGKAAAPVGASSLEVDVWYQGPSPDVEPKTPPPPLAIAGARVLVSMSKRGVSWQGITTIADPKATPAVAAWTATKLKPGKYVAHVVHDCLVQVGSDPTVSVKGKTTSKVLMDAPDLRKAANEKGVILGARRSTQQDLPNLKDKQNPTVLATFNDVVIGTFLGSRWPQEPESTVDLSDATQPTPGFGWGGAQQELDFAQDHSLQIMTTPLVWPMPKCTPDWPCGSPRAHLNAVDKQSKKSIPYVPFEDSYVFRRAKGLGKPGDVEVERQAGMDVHKRYITTVINAVKSRTDPRPGFPGVPTAPWHVVVNESLNLRYGGEQANATADSDFARDHPLWQRFGLWDVDESEHNVSQGYPEGIVKGSKLWENIRDCFLAANKADPNALLILNDYSVEAYHPGTDYYALLKARNDADKPLRVTRAKAWAIASARLRAAEKKAQKSGDALDKKARPRSTYQPNQAYSATVSHGKTPTCAEATFDSAVAAAAATFDRDLQMAEDFSDGTASQEAHYTNNLAAAKKKYADARGAASTTYTAVVKSAEAARKTARDAAAKVDSDAIAARKATPTLPVPTLQLPPHADAEYTAIHKDAEVRYKAAVARHSSIFSAKKAYWAAYHRAQVQFRRGYTTAKQKASAAYDHAEKPQLFFRLVEWLVKNTIIRSKLVIGFQMHYPKSPAQSGYSPAAIARNVARYAQLKLPVVITELDISYEGLEAIRQKQQKAKQTPGVYEEAASSQHVFMPLYRVQAERFREVIAAVLSSRNCLGITTWGVADYAEKTPAGDAVQFRYMGYWFHPTFTCTNPQPCPGDAPHDQYFRKPAYAASVTAFLAAQPQLSDAEIRAGKAGPPAKAQKPKAAKKGHP